MEPTQLSDQERIRGYVVDVLINKFLHFGLNREEVAALAKDVLAKTEGVATDAELEKALHDLVQNHPKLKNAEIQEWDFKDHQMTQEKTNRLIELLHQGDLEQAVQLAHQFEEGV